MSDAGRTRSGVNMVDKRLYIGRRSLDYQAKIKKILISKRARTNHFKQFFGIQDIQNNNSHF